MSFDTIILDISDGAARLTLNRPEKRNAFNVRMHLEVREALALAIASGARVLSLTGAGEAFCAGQDLSERVRQPGEPPVDLGDSIERFYKPLCLSLRNLPIPVVAAVNGVAAGAGANLALACDLVVAKKSASFIQSFSKLGLVPDCGGTWTLPRLVGQARALGLSLLGERIFAQQAETWGMIWKCVEDEEFDAAIDDLLERLSSAPTLGLAGTKSALYAGSTGTFEASLDTERDHQRELGKTRDYAEGVAAFREKRSPTFKGA
jgi:2-(1,2-epoxy-1,2-dihydrophenyl)acetyl-CoA isomerase